jgi:secreted trypsin-like serine protease
MKFRALALVSLAVSAAACVPAGGPGESQEAIVGGTADTGDPGVMLVIFDQGAQGASLCTGELLSPHVIMTAAHCVDPAVVGKTGTFKVFPGNNLSQANLQTDLLAVKETHYNTAFDVNNLTGGNDIAVVILQNPVTNVMPLVMNRQAIDNNLVGSSVRLVGYGITSSTDTNGTTAGVKRQTTTTLAGFDDVLINFMDPQHLTCEGDSGGPAFMTIGGQEVIAGITSFGDKNCMQFGYDTRVDKFADSFVQPYIDMFDPKPKVPGPDGFIPGTVGATCMAESDCDSHTCAFSGNSGFCTASCDPKNDQCPAMTHCGTVDNQPFCVRNSSGGGCEMSGAGAGSAAGLLLLSAALLMIVLRRRA